MKSKKKETYRDRWLREHKEVRFYIKKDDYKLLQELAISRGLTIKDLILNHIKGISKVCRRVSKLGYTKAIDDFILNPYTFYLGIRELYDGDIALFIIPCSVCGKPMVFTHRDSDWKNKIKPILLEAFSNWAHTQCLKKKK